MAKSKGGQVTGLVKRPLKDAAATIRRMASGGASQESIANALDTTPKTLRAWLKEDATLQAAYDEGREKERLALHKSLYRRAMDEKNAQGAASAMFLLKARHNYRENEPSPDAARVAVVFNIPAALPPEQYLKTVKAINGSSESN